MKFTVIYNYLIMMLVIQACAQEPKKDIKHTPNITTSSKPISTAIINNSGNTLATRINPPKNYIRTTEPSNSYAQYLRNLPLKPQGSLVSYYNGTSKPNHNVYEAVIDLPIGKKDLHQCADAVMRLRAEYLWYQKKYNQIHFNFTNGFNVAYTEWIKGKRIAVKGNKTSWFQKTTPSNTYNDFWNYMEIIFSYAGTLSLAKELKSVQIDDIKIGDVFIQGGSPGHAILVIDMAINPKTNKQMFLLAQSYMPAQEIQILKNPNNKDTPWYSTDINELLITPEWTFNIEDLKRFND